MCITIWDCEVKAQCTINSCPRREVTLARRLQAVDKSGSRQYDSFIRQFVLLMDAGCAMVSPEQDIALCAALTLLAKPAVPQSMSVVEVGLLEW